MFQPSLSTFNSEMLSRLLSRQPRLVALLQTLFWTLLFVLIADVTINLTLSMPKDPKVKPEGLTNYFDYGRSVEGKLRHSLGTSDENASPLSAAGWLDRDCQRSIAEVPQHRVISFFGMSFSNDVAIALQALDRTFTPVLFAGPAAPPNHSYRCFLLQQNYAEHNGRDGSEIQVLGLLASSVKGLLSMTGATTGFEGAAPFTYPRYEIDASGSLQETLPLIGSADDWRKSLVNPALRQALLAQLSKKDIFFDPILFNASWADSSAILRMLRRGYAQSRSRDLAESVMGANGYLERPEVGPVLKAIVLDYAARSRAAGKRPVVLLLQDGQSGNALFRLLSGTLEKDAVEYVSTHSIAPTSDSSNFIGDGHFTAAANKRIAEKLHDLLIR